MRARALLSASTAAVLALTLGVGSANASDEDPSPHRMHPADTQAAPDGVAQPAKRTWPILPAVKLPGFPYFDGPSSVAVNGSGTRAFVLGPTQMVTVNIERRRGRVLGRSVNVQGSQIVANPKHPAAYVVAPGGETLKALNVRHRHAKITKRISYRCGSWCGIPDLTVTSGGRYLLVLYDDYPNRLDVYSLERPFKPRRIARKKLPMNPEYAKYMVLNIRGRHHRHPRIVKRPTGLPFDDAGPVLARASSHRVYLIGQNTMDAVFVADYSVAKNRLTRSKKVVPPVNNVSGAALSVRGAWMYITWSGIPSDATMCVIGTKRLRRRSCYSGMDSPVAGVATSPAGRSKNRVYIPAGQVNTHSAWLNVLGRSHR